MSLFIGLGDSATRQKIIEPPRLFRSLPNREERFVAPRDIQTEVWDRWFSRRGERDLILKMNTGSGKTVVGLLILQSSLNEGITPGVYLVPDRYLQKQVVDTAKALGIACTTDIADQDFRRGQSILVVTMSKLVNGLSQFGVRGGPPGRRIQIGTLVIDDAHACIPIVEKQFSITIERDDTYRALLDLFADDIKRQSLASWHEIRDAVGSAAVAIPYWAWQNKLDRAAQILSGQAEDDENKFTWPLIKDHLGLCDVAITPTEIEIALPAPFLDAIPSFAGAQRRIYMTATLADDTVVVSRLGADPSTVMMPVTPAFASDLGDRMILTPLETSRRVSLENVRDAAKKLAQRHNVVVIVPSRYRANAWIPYTTEIHDKNTISNVVERLVRGQVGLVVLIAKYDGVDLPGDACRILIIDGLPERYSPIERVEADALGDTDVIRINQIQRIEQGMGRGVRSATDYAAVILLDPRLVQRLDLAADLALLSPGTRAQLQLSQELAQSLSGKGIDLFEKAISDFLARDPQWTAAAKGVIDALAYPPPTQVDRYIVNERDAFGLALQGRFQEAAECILNQVETINDAWLRGWSKQRAAGYLHHVDPVRAKEIQRSALIDNNFLSRPEMDVVVPKLRLARQQAEMARTHIADTFDSPRRFEIAIEALLANLTPTPVRGSHRAFELALHELGQILGFGSARPDHDYRVGPDNLWAIGGDDYWVIECKSEAVSETISRSDLEQLSHSIDWFKSEYREPRYTATPVIIHPSRTPKSDAVPREGARVMTFGKLAEFRGAVRGWAQAILVDGRFQDEAIIAAALSQSGLLRNQIEQRWTQKFV